MTIRTASCSSPPPIGSFNSLRPADSSVFSHYKAHQDVSLEMKFPGLLRVPDMIMKKFHQSRFPTRELRHLLNESTKLKAGYRKSIRYVLWKNASERG